MEFCPAKPHREPEMDTTAWEEDEFYIELRGQILSLTADEDEDEDGFLDVRGHHSWALDGSTARQLPNHFGVTKNIHAGGGMDSQVDKPRNVNGTGVFIPTADASRRRGRLGRNNQRRVAYKQVGRTCDSTSLAAGLKSSSAKC